MFMQCIVHVYLSDSDPSQMPSNLEPPLQAQQKPMTALPSLPSEELDFVFVNTLISCDLTSYSSTASDFWCSYIICI